jgi:CDP-glucose 4,6-dehydratase
MTVNHSMNPQFWHGRRVFITGHTGFKGSWLATWLHRLGADVTGYALPAPTEPSLFQVARLEEKVTSLLGDVRDLEGMRAALEASRAEVVFHLAAQSLVRPSYVRPVETYATNVMGTVNILEAVRSRDHVQAVVVVTSDKCYENREWIWPFRENEPMGGHDPYSSSKGCAELVTAAYRRSFFSKDNGPGIATARAGNVIGGGDWAADRLVPDLLRAFSEGEIAQIRNPLAIRPWQHVLEPLNGYMTLAEQLFARMSVDEPWNFGPLESDVRSVGAVADAIASRWSGDASWRHDGGSQRHEAATLKLDSAKARAVLRWVPRLSLDLALDWVVEWHQAFEREPRRAHALTTEQITRYEALAP